MIYQKRYDFATTNSLSLLLLYSQMCYLNQQLYVQVEIDYIDKNWKCSNWQRLEIDWIDNHYKLIALTITKAYWIDNNYKCIELATSNNW